MGRRLYTQTQKSRKTCCQFLTHCYTCTHTQFLITVFLDRAATPSSSRYKCMGAHSYKVQLYYYTLYFIIIIAHCGQTSKDCPTHACMLGVLKSECGTIMVRFYLKHHPSPQTRLPVHPREDGLAIKLSESTISLQSALPKSKCIHHDELQWSQYRVESCNLIVLLIGKAYLFHRSSLV